MLGPAMFDLTATGLTSDTTLMINATPAEVDSSDFLTDEVADTANNFPVEFTDPDGDNTYDGTLAVTLEDDDDGEATGEIKVTLNIESIPVRTYRLSSDVEGTITILDDDAPELTIAGVSDVTEAPGAMANV